MARAGPCYGSGALGIEGVGVAGAVGPKGEGFGWRGNGCPNKVVHVRQLRTRALSEHCRPSGPTGSQCSEKGGPHDGGRGGTRSSVGEQWCHRCSGELRPRGTSARACPTCRLESVEVVGVDGCQGLKKDAVEEASHEVEFMDAFPFVQLAGTSTDQADQSLQREAPGQRGSNRPSDSEASALHTGPLYVLDRSLARIRGVLRRTAYRPLQVARGPTNALAPPTLTTTRLRAKRQWANQSMAC